LVKAAITYSKGKDFSIEDIEIDEPNAGEVLVKIIASGMCHTDLLARDEISYVPLPAVLGHEGAGIVEKVGKDVTSVVPGDHVLLTFHSCGQCEHCYDGKPYVCDDFFALNFSDEERKKSSPLRKANKNLTNFFGQSSFAHYSLANERNIVKVPKDVPLEILAPLGCGVITGAGAIFNKLKPNVGSSIAIFGCGAVGLSALMAAKVIGCTEIIAVDIHRVRLDLARELGATHIIHSQQEDVVEAIKKITGKGVNFAVETSAIPAVIRQSVDSLAALGTSALIGSSNDNVELNIRTLRNERTVTGVLEGSGSPHVLIPRLIELYKVGKFPIEKLITFYPFEEINQAALDAERGITIKPVLKMV
jgi:aryl-alcohol dehydrogenase